MQPLARFAPRLRLAATPLRGLRSFAPLSASATAPGHAGPPPAPPAAEYEGIERVRRRRRQAEMLREAKEGKGRKGLKRRFWNEVTVREADGHLQVFLDERPLRHPATKQIVKIPATKPHLATALAIEWDVLSSAQDATKHHRIPLTCLICRAIDLEAEGPSSAARETVADTLMRYLDTDSILCWAPDDDKTGDLRVTQKAVAEEVVGFMTERVWPGTTIVPVLDGNSIFPRPQDAATRAVVRGWVSGLSGWELAGLERAVLAGKSLIIGARLMVEWSEGKVGMASFDAEGGRFGVERAAKAATLEVGWQTGKWGEVEDTHDVEKEDVRRQLGSAVLLVTGSGQ